MENPRFDERMGPHSHNWRQDSANHVTRYLFAADHVRGKRALDAGTGYGYGALILKVQGASEVQAVDIDAGSIDLARQRFGREGLEYLVDDCEQLGKVRGPFGVITNFENIEHLNRPEAFLEAVARLLADDGVFFCSTPDRAISKTDGDKPSNPYHVREWYRDEFQALLDRYFEDVEIRVQIENLTMARQREGRDQLIKHLTYLWSTPLMRASRALGRLLGQQPPSWEELYFLSSPSPDEFPIVRHPIADLLGTTQVHFAICRKPRRS
jgi:SAM-dependent methyltransferase